MPNYRTRVYGVGTLAYLDSLYSGLVPCKVIDITGAGDGGKVTVKLTASRGGYSRGETVETHPGHVIPRDKVRTRDGQLRIITSYVWAPEMPAGGADIFMGPALEGIGAGDAIFVRGAYSIVTRVSILPRGHGQAPIRNDYLCVKVDTLETVMHGDAGCRFFGATEAYIGADLRVHFKVDRLATFDPTDTRVRDAV